MRSNGLHGTNLLLLGYNINKGRGDYDMTIISTQHQLSHSKMLTPPFQAIVTKDYQKNKTKQNCLYFSLPVYFTGKLLFIKCELT